MLASIAFLSAGALIISFSFALGKLMRKTNMEFYGFDLAYFLLGLAFIGYSVATLIDTQPALENVMLIGNFLMFSATAILVLRKFFIGRTALLIGALGMGLGFTALRALLFYPEPNLREGILYFNTQPVVGIFIALLFLCIWLPTSLIFSKKVSTIIKFNELYIIYSGLFALATMSAIFFLASRNSLSLVITFSSITASFLALLTISLLAYGIRSNE